MSTLNVNTISNAAGSGAPDFPNGVSVNSNPIATAGSLSNRNKLINGNFDIWQRGVSFSSPSTGQYNADRWITGYNGSGATRTISRQNFTLGQTDVPYEPSYFLRFNQSVGGSGASFNTLYQKIEDVRTFAGQTVTLSFWAKAASALTMPNISIRQQFGTGGSPSSFVDVVAASSVSVSTSWTKYTYTATLGSLSGKTLGTNNNSTLQVYFFLPVNTTFTFDIAQVQLEAGDVATPFEMRPIGQELALCQRYYEVTNGAANRASASNHTASGGIRWSLAFMVEKRATPSVTLGTIVKSATLNDATVDSVSVSGANFNALFNSSTSATSNTYFEVKADAEL